MSLDFRVTLAALVMAVAALSLCANPRGNQQAAESPSYLQLTEPRHVLPDAQAWEGNQFPHTLSVLEWNHKGYRYWGWYGLNEGRGIGLARSNDLINWTKYEQNPLWTNARWPSVVPGKTKTDQKPLYFAITRDYDTPSSYIILASSRDGIHLKEEKVLVAKVDNQRNQNPNLFHDPTSEKYFLTFYRGNDHDHFEIVSKSATSIGGLAAASEKALLTSDTTIAAPTLLFVPNARPGGSGLYYLATEIYPYRYTNNPEGEWQVQVYWSDTADGLFLSLPNGPVLTGQRACLFQHAFHGRFYGFDCHLKGTDQWELEEVEASLPPPLNLGEPRR
jgi:hypothetical protein